MKKIHLLFVFLCSFALTSENNSAMQSEEIETLRSLQEEYRKFYDECKENPSALFTVAAYHRKPPVVELCTQPDYAPLLKGLLERKLLKVDSVWEHSRGSHPLIILAVGACAVPNLQALLDADVNPNVVGTNPSALLSKCTPISLAVEKEHPKMLEMLLKKGALTSNISLVVPTPLKLAVDRVFIGDREKIEKMIRVLLNNYADPKEYDVVASRLSNKSTGTYTVNTALDLAKARKYTDIVQMLTDHKEYLD